MAELTKLDVGFRLRGNSLDPEEVSRALGISPSFALAMGAVNPRTGERQPTGVWLLKSGDIARSRGHTLLDCHIRSLLDRLEDKVETVKGFVRRRHRADFYCSCYMQIQNEGTEVSPGTIRRMADLGAGLNVSVWIPVDQMD